MGADSGRESAWGGFCERVHSWVSRNKRPYPMTTETTESTLLTRHQAAAVAAVSLRKIDGLIAARAIEFVKIGAAVRISREALRRFIESRTVSSRN